MWARVGYTWVPRSGPKCTVSFTVRDAAIADGKISREELIDPANPVRFVAATPAGVFTDLLAGSALAVDPHTGAVIDSANALTAVNAQHRLLVTARDVLVPTSRWQSRSRGHWKVTRDVESPRAIPTNGTVPDGSPVTSRSTINPSQEQ